MNNRGEEQPDEEAASSNGGGGGRSGSSSSAAARAESNEEAIAMARAHFMPDYLAGPIDSSRLELSQAERDWARQVKQAIMNDPELDVLSDFLCAQIALVEWESRSLENALNRAKSYLAFKQEFDILDTFEQGKDALEYFIRRHPGYVLHFFLGERYTVVWDITKFDITCLDTPRETQKIMMGGHYMNHSFSPDLAAIRKGLLWIFECEGFMWKAPRMMNSRVFRIWFQDLASNYPYKLHQVVFQNAGVLVNTLVSSARGYLPSAIHSKFQFGSRHETRMDTVCLVPSLEAALDRLVRELTESLRRRFEAEKTFRLV
jgi:CRAL/TRIO domain